MGDRPLDEGHGADRVPRPRPRQAHAKAVHAAFLTRECSGAQCALLATEPPAAAGLVSARACATSNSGSKGLCNTWHPGGRSGPVLNAVRTTTGTSARRPMAFILARTCQPGTCGIIR